MRVLLADDESMVRSALRLICEQNIALTVVGEVTTVGEIRDTLAETRPELLLMDGELPGAIMDTLIPEIRRGRDGLVIVVLSGRIEAKETALHAGADAFISKGDPPDALIETLLDLADVHGCVC